MGFAALWLGACLVGQAPAPAAAAVTPDQIIAALEGAVGEAIARAEPSVVAIVRARNPAGPETLAVRGRQPGEDPRDPFAGAVPDLSGPDYLPLPGDFGAGVVIGTKGEILTAFHVVMGSSRIHVRAAGEQSFDAEVIAADPRSDLAVIAPRPTAGRKPPVLKPLPLGDADTLRKGAFLIALGNPYFTARDGNSSASWGILANKARRIVPTEADDPARRQAFKHQAFLLQLDAKLNLGMSGGAVVNLKGELVGITTNGGSAEGYDALSGYAVPMDGLGRRIVQALLEGNEVEYGFLGIRLDQDAPNIVGGVEPGTPAAEGDLILGDVIQEVDGIPVSANTGLALALGRATVGEPVRLKVLRGFSTVEKTVFLSKYPLVGETIATRPPETWRGLSVDYTSALVGPAGSDAVLRAMAQGPIAVARVAEETAAAAGGLARGRVITAVNGKPVRTPRAFFEAVRAAEGPVTLRTPDGDVTVEP